MRIWTAYKSLIFIRRPANIECFMVFGPFTL